MREKKDKKNDLSMHNLQDLHIKTLLSDLLNEKNQDRNNKINSIINNDKNFELFKGFLNEYNTDIISLQIGAYGNSQYSEFTEHNYSNFTAESDLRNHSHNVQDLSMDSIKDSIENKLEVLDNIGKPRKDRSTKRNETEGKDVALNNPNPGYKLKKESRTVTPPKQYSITNTINTYIDNPERVRGIFDLRKIVNNLSEQEPNYLKDKGLFIKQNLQKAIFNEKDPKYLLDALLAASKHRNPIQQIIHGKYNTNTNTAKELIQSIENNPELKKTITQFLADRFKIDHSLIAGQEWKNYLKNYVIEEGKKLDKEKQSIR